MILDDLIEELSHFLKFSFHSSSKSEEQMTQNLNQEDLHKIITLFESTLKEEWMYIKDRGDFGLIQSFGEKIKTLAQKYKSALLENYSEQLLKNIEAFDIEKVDYLMNSYTELIEKLKEKCE